MANLVISCLSQKGGVGKSTLARLIATAYAAHDQRTAIMDFNPKQQTSVTWADLRREAGIKPDVHAEVARQANRLRTNKNFDVVVADGRPDSPEVTLTIAQTSDLVVIPTSVTLDDLVPQHKFAQELVSLGIPTSKILFVINRTTENELLIQDAIDYLSDEFRVAKVTLPYRDSFIRCHTAGFSVGEIKSAVMGNMSRLAALTSELATEIAAIASGEE